ncbi:hypothetical protein [Halobacterium yunchengense]|uniref:hypothetical protein n=1 Tax=Halobacterium yunchengense TaxID=3108497 RepID=UPI00300B1981
MTDGFTMDAYGDLLDALADAGYAFLTVRDYLARDGLPERFVVLRHDVDRKPGNADRMAALEADRGVRATYYYRTSTFDAERVRRLEGLGHEVGYHYEDYVRAGGDLEDAHRLFANNLRVFRRDCTVETVCMHGNPLSPHDNREMWTADGAPGFAAYGLLGEAYLSVDFEDVAYFSDTGRTWRDGPLKIKDHTMGDGGRRAAADTTGDLAAVFRGGDVDRACVLAHPERWADSLPELVAARSKDGAVNLVKRGMHLLDYGAAGARPTSTPNDDQ